MAEIVTWDATKKNHSSTIYSNNNLTAYLYHSSQTVISTHAKDKGKWYFELKMGTIINTHVGIVAADAGLALTYNSPKSRYYSAAYGTKSEGASSSTYGATYAAGNIIGVALDLDNGTITFYKNGVSQGIAFTNLLSLGAVYPAFTTNGTSSGNTITTNFGDQPFTYPIPDGYKPYGSLPYLKILLQSNDKAYSHESADNWHKANMTSNTAPIPLIASASSYYANGSSYAAWRAFSESTNNWYAEKLPQWIQLNFGQKMTLNRVKLKSATRQEETPKVFAILGSNDGANFDVINSYSMDAWAVSTWKEFHFKKSEYTIYRILVTECFNKGNRVAINQIVYGFKDASLIGIPTLNDKNFIKYGRDSMLYLNNPLGNKNYILQDKVSKNEEGLLTNQLDRRPLSIKFD